MDEAKKLTIGQAYDPHEGIDVRTIISIEGDVVTYRQKGVLTFMPLEASRAEFQNWLSGWPSTSTILPPAGMTIETLMEAIAMVSKWEDEGEDPADLAIALFEFFKSRNPVAGS